MSAKVPKLSEIEKFEAQQEKNRFFNWLMAAEFSALTFVSGNLWLVCSMLYWSSVNEKVASDNIWQSYISVANFINSMSIATHAGVLVILILFFALIGMFIYSTGCVSSYKSSTIILGSLTILEFFGGPIMLGLLGICNLLGRFFEWLTKLQIPITFIPWVAGTVIIAISIFIIVSINKMKKDDSIKIYER